MSMWLQLVKVDAALLPSLRANPDLVGVLFGDEDDAVRPPAEFRPYVDAYEFDYRTIDSIAEGRAEAEEGTSDWMSAYPWLAKATGHECDVLDDYEFCYGPAFVLGPDEARDIARGLVAEGWFRSAEAARWTGSDEDNEFEDLGPFLASAAAEAKVVIGGVN